MSSPAPILPARLTVVIPCYNERANVAPLVARLEAALRGIAWEAVFVDDNSPDGTAAMVREIAAHDPRIRGLRRVGRRGLSSAVIEGALSSSAEFVAVIDGDMQHDETRLKPMLARLAAGEGDIVIGSRYAAGGDAKGLAGSFRQRLSRLGIRFAQIFLPAPVSDPMSGFFMMRRQRFEEIAPRLAGSGFKILLDLLFNARPPLKVIEVPFEFRARAFGESKLDALVLAQFAGLLIDRVLRGAVPLRFIAFAGVGLVGVGANIASLALGRALGLGFSLAQAIATVIAMGVNFQLNNTLTYRDQRLRGARLWRGLVLFMLFCGIGAVADLGIARTLYEDHNSLTVAGAAGAIVAVVWNYAISATLVWRAR
jgi:dolichol-phosphate mannosyltransferase